MISGGRSFAGQEGKLGHVRIILKSSREFFKGDFVEDRECGALEDAVSLLGVHDPSG